MKWSKTIKVQAESSQESIVENELLNMAHDVQKRSDFPGLLDVIVYSNALVPGYFAIYLSWDTKHAQIQGSSIGLNLAQALKAFGMVNHSVWIENTYKGDENSEK